MNKLNERIRELRKGLHLSQEYVANYLGMNRTTYTLMENGVRKITADDVQKLSNLFSVSTDYLFGNQEISEPGIVFARSFEKLSENDQAEIMNLIRFKEQLKKK